MNTYCQHERLLVEQEQVFIKGKWENSSRYESCPDCGMGRITTQKEAFLSDSTPRRIVPAHQTKASTS